MVHTGAITVAAAALLSALPVSAGLYSKSSPVLQIDAKNYDRLIAQSNYTSIVEFYAPWCGHCKSLQPAYEKAAKNLEGLAKVAAVNCDDDANKQFCGGFGVQGFPTLKIVKPGKKSGSPVVEDYMGPRTAKGIVDAVIDKMPNIVKRVNDKDLGSFLAEANDTAKAILFTNQGKTPALLKAVALDFKGSISVAQIRNTDREKESLELFGITEFPTVVLLPGGEADGIVYDGELNKESIVKFLSQVATPNADPAPAKIKLPKKKEGKKAEKEAQEASESASSSHTSGEDNEEVLEESSQPPKSQKPNNPTEMPIIQEDPIPLIPALFTEEDLRRECLGERTGTCILVLVSDNRNDLTIKTLESLGEVAHKHSIHHRANLPFYVVPQSNAGYGPLKLGIGLGGDTEVIAVNGRRGWWRHLPNSQYYLEEEVSVEAIVNWVEAIRVGEGAKNQLPEDLIVRETVVEEPAAAEEFSVDETEVQEPVAQETSSEDVKTEELEDATEPLLEEVVESEPVAEETDPEYVKSEEPQADVHDEL